MYPASKGTMVCLSTPSGFHRNDGPCAFYEVDGGDENAPILVNCHASRTDLLLAYYDGEVFVWCQPKDAASRYIAKEQIAVTIERRPFQNDMFVGDLKPRLGDNRLELCSEGGTGTGPRVWES